MRCADDLSWLRSCEKLRDSSGKPLLRFLEFDKDGHYNHKEAHDGEILQRLEYFVKKSSASSSVVKEIEVILSSTIFNILLEISKMFDEKEPIHILDQNVEYKVRIAISKLSFICHKFITALLTSRSSKWQAIHEDLVEICLSTLYSLPKKLESMPHHDKDGLKVTKHYKTKKFLSTASLFIWKDILCELSIQVEPSILIPILRRLAMSDILDENWNEVGTWEDILKYVQTCCNVSIIRMQSDTVLNQTSIHLREGRDSLRLKQQYLTRQWKSAADDVPLCWTLQRKCSSPSCSNMETRGKPHSLRCRQCWYFHWCSKACEEYCCSITNIHSSLCHDTPPDKRQSMQKQVEVFLSSREEIQVMNDFCSSCGSHVDDIAIALKQCVNCKTVAYCSKLCQQWDWMYGGHRNSCKFLSRKSTPCTADSTSCYSKNMRPISSTSSDL